MEKRLPLFLFLSFAILFGWQLLFPPPPPQPGAEGGVDPAAQGGAVAEASALPAIPEDVEQAEPWDEWIELGAAGSPGHYRARFSSMGGTLQELRLDGWYDSGRLSEEARSDPGHWTQLLAPATAGPRTLAALQLETAPSSVDLFPAGLGRVHWHHELLTEGDTTIGVRFWHQPSPSSLRVVKEVRRVEGALHLAVTLRLESPAEGGAGRRASFTLVPAAGMPETSEDKYYVEPKARKAYRSGSEVEVASEERAVRPGEDDMSGTLPSGDGTLFVGSDNKYFAVLLRGAMQADTDTLGATSWVRTRDEVWATENPDRQEEAWRGLAVEQELTLQVPAAGASTVYAYELFAGPKEAELLLADNEVHEFLIEDDLGFFSGIAGLLLGLLGVLEGLLGNWGIAIIVLTLLVRGTLFPMNRKSQTSMARHTTKMKRVQPKLDALKEKYKNDPQKQRQEQAKIMQEEGAFPPLSGCLPMFLQIPVFFGLFSALRVSFDLRQARFLWVEDLSMPDRLLRLDLDTHLPLIGTIEYLNVLPPLMVVLWILQQRLMPKPTDEQAARMQRMMMWMPVLFGVFLYNYAAGLSLYMITSSLFGIAEYTIIRRIWPIDDSEKPRKPSKFLQRLQELQEQQAQLQRQQQSRSKNRKQRR